MSKHSELMRSVLAAAQRFDTPDDALQDKVWAAVEQRVDAGDPGLSLSDGSSAAIGSGSAGWLTPLKVLAVVGVVGLAAGAIAFTRGGSEPEDVAAAPAIIDEPAPAPEPEPDVQQPEPPPVVAPEVVAEPVDVAEPDKPEPSTRARKSQRPAVELDATDSLGAEVELLRRARAAANAGNHREALTVLEEHKRRFPRGKLARERDMSRLRAFCALGRQGDAKKLASSMLARDGSDVLRAKLAKTCAGE